MWVTPLMAALPPKVYLYAQTKLPATFVLRLTKMGMLSKLIAT